MRNILLIIFLIGGLICGPNVIWAGDAATFMGKAPSAISTIMGKSIGAIATFAGASVPAGCGESIFEDYADFTTSVWTSESDADNDGNVVGGAYVVTVDDDNQANLRKTLAQNYTEIWGQFTFSISNVTQWQANSYFDIFTLHDTAGTGQVTLRLLSSGTTLATLRAMGTSVNDDLAISLSVDTPYTVKFHYKRETSADAGDGIFQVYFNGSGSPDPSITTDTSYERNGVGHIRMGYIFGSTAHDGANNWTVTTDSVELRSDDCFE